MPTAVPAAPVDQARPELWRITDRRTFVILREQGRRARHVAAAVTYLGPTAGTEGDPPRVGFAVNKAIGGAVVRNRVKRRLRAALRELQRAGALPQGTYLVSARAQAATMPWSALVSDLHDAVTEATR